VPVTVKQTFGMAGRTITAGSRRMPPIPMDHDCPIVRRVRESGAILLARSNTPELTMSHETDNLLAGRTNNPLDGTRTAGGSSGGEAALVAAGASALGFGSDIGGSIRFPAHCCGIVGFKPDSSAVDGRGTFPPDKPPDFGDTLLGFGPMARSVRDARLGFEVLAGRDLPPPASVGGLRLLVPSVPVGTIRDAAIARAVARARSILTRAGMRVETADAGDADDLFRLWQRVIVGFSETPMREHLRDANGEAFSLAREAIARLAGRPTVWRGVFLALLGMRIVRPSPEALAEAVARTRERRARWRSVLGGDGVLLLPTAGFLAPRHGRAMLLDNLPGVPGVYVPLAFANLLDLPAISVPAWPDAAPLPPGVQLVAAPGAEAALLDAAAALEAGFAAARC
jgi:Asp-tRNA(Asn)/Glu-tRNA(Gln) amidotransferase A subunit family amidase